MLRFIAIKISLLFILVSSLEREAVAATDNTPSLSAIVAGAIARDDANQVALRTMQYRQVTHTEQINSSGRVSGQQDIEMIVRPGAAQEIQVVSMKGDRIPGDPDEAIQRAKGQETERRKHNFSLKTLATRFDISLMGQGECEGLPAYVLSFEPKSNQPFRDYTEKVLNQLHGRIWVAKSDDRVLKTEATLLHPVSIAWIFAKIVTLDFNYELRSSTSAFGPAWLQVVVKVETPILTVHQRQTVDMTKFQGRTPVGLVRTP